MPNLFEHCRAGVSVYPASGFRASDSGGLNVVGANGYTWSNAPTVATNVGGSVLSFNNPGVHPEYDTSRAYGFPVRCVQE